MVRTTIIGEDFINSDDDDDGDDDGNDDDDGGDDDDDDSGSDDYDDDNHCYEFIARLAECIFKLLCNAATMFAN